MGPGLARPPWSTTPQVCRLPLLKQKRQKQNPAYSSEPSTSGNSYSHQSYPTHTFQSSSVLPTFINGGENICWLNSSMHLLLALYKQQNHDTANNHLIHEESLFWNFIEYLKISKPRQHELFSPQQICKVGNSLKTMRYLFAKIAVDNH